MKPDHPADPTGRRRAAMRFVATGVVRMLAVVALVAASALPAAMAGEGRMGGRGARGPGLRAAQINNRMMRQERFQNGGPRGLPGREPIAQPQPQPQIVERPIEPTPVPADRGGRPGRLTPEERRALRQQINDAGRDIYRVP